GRHALAAVSRPLEQIGEPWVAGVWPTELQTHAQRQDAADAQEDQRRKQELNPDDLVIFGKDVLAQKARLMMSMGCGFVRKIDAHNSLGLGGERARFVSFGISLLLNRLRLSNPANSGLLAVLILLGLFQPGVKVGLVLVDKEPAHHFVVPPAAQF